MEPVVTQEPPASASTPETRIVCRVRQKQFARHTCPRCNSRYCSLQCYKGHSACCTESFMRENVMEEMWHIQPEDETKRKMLDILKRFHSEEEIEYEDEDDFTLSQETIQKFLSGDNLQFEDLSAEEMKQFQRAVASGKLSKMIELWEPWWLKPSARTISLGQDGTQLVRPVDECDFETSSQDIPESNLFEIPAGPDTPLPPLSKLNSTDPSPLLGVHLVDVLYRYCFTLRLYNGDWNCDPLGAAMVILNISSVLGKGGQPETIVETLSKCIEETCSPIYRHAGGFRFALGLIDDVIILLSLSTNALICLLCDLRRLILAGEKMLKTEKTGKAKRDESRSKLKCADRKLYFLMCWVREQPRQAWSCTQSMVSAEKASLSKVEQELKNSVTEARGEPKSSVLIEEV